MDHMHTPFHCCFLCINTCMVSLFQFSREMVIQSLYICSLFWPLDENIHSSQKGSNEAPMLLSLQTQVPSFNSFHRIFTDKINVYPQIFTIRTLTLIVRFLHYIKKIQTASRKVYWNSWQFGPQAEWSKCAKLGNHTKNFLFTSGALIMICSITRSWFIQMIMHFDAICLLIINILLPVILSNK